LFAEDRALMVQAKTSICAKAEHKLLKMVSLSHRCIRGAYMAQQNRISNS